MRTVGNFLSKESYPLDSNTLARLQDNDTLLAMLGAIAGDKIILAGGEISDNTHGTGYAYIKTDAYPNGEVLQFAAGLNSGFLKVEAENKSVIAVGESGTEQAVYEAAYTERKLVVCSEGDDGAIPWDDFTPLMGKTNVELKQALDNALRQIALLNNPVGGIIIWPGGDGSDIPDGYLLCNGAEYKQSDYPSLYDVIGTAYNSASDYLNQTQTTQSGYFRVPDLRGRFIVGQLPGDESSEGNFANKGATGGEKEHTLTVEEMPSHTHRFSYYGHQNGNNKIDHGNDYTLDGWLTGNTGSVGGDQSHNNLPPYYVLSYIIKAR